MFSLLHKKKQQQRQKKKTLLVSVHFYMWRVWSFVSSCMCVRERGGELGSEWRDPCAMSCEPPLSPSSTVVASVPLIPPKNTKAGTVFTIGYEMANHPVFPRRVTRCTPPSAGGGLQCAPCVSPMTPSSFVLERLTGDRSYRRCMRQKGGAELSPASPMRRDALPNSIPRI